MKRSLRLAAVAAAAVASASAVAAPAFAAPDETTTAFRAQHVDTTLPDSPTLEVMARSAGRSVAAQKRVISTQIAQNNALADLQDQGHRYDGAYFTGDSLTVQAKAGSADAAAAERVGLKVRQARHGEVALNKLSKELAKADQRGVASISPDVAADKVVVRTDGEVSPALRAIAERHGDAVTFTKGAGVEKQATINPGTEIGMDNKYVCSAGFPASKGSTKVMVWAGHCVEGISNFTLKGSPIGTFGATAFHTGAAGKDFGYVKLTSPNTVSTSLNQYGTSGLISPSATSAWKAPVGTELCKSGRTTGITCGKVSAYNTTVNYEDGSRISGLATSTVCTEGGDSGGAYVSANKGVGMTSGGPVDSDCGGFNSGFRSSSSQASYFAPLPDALAYFGLTFGH